jgi:hypothetical protein
MKGGIDLTGCNPIVSRMPGQILAANRRRVRQRSALNLLQDTITNHNMQGGGKGNEKTSTR